MASFVCPLVKPGVEEVEIFRPHKQFIMNCRKISLTLIMKCTSFYLMCAFAVAAVKVVDTNIINSFSFASKNDLMLSDFWETLAIFKSMRCRKALLKAVGICTGLKACLCEFKNDSWLLVCSMQQRAPSVS